MGCPAVILCYVETGRGRSTRPACLNCVVGWFSKGCDSVLTNRLLFNQRRVACRVVFPDFNYQWLVDEIKENLPRELDFQHEAANAERCRANLASSKSRLRGRLEEATAHVNSSSFIETSNTSHHANPQPLNQIKTINPPPNNKGSTSRRSTTASPRVAF